MVVVTIDPGLLTFPTESSEALSNRIQSLVFCRKTQQRYKWIHLCVTQRTVNVLAAQGLYPAFPSIKAALTNSNLNSVYSAADVLRVVTALLDSAKLEDHCPFQDVGWSNLTISPNLVPTSENEAVQNELIRTLVMLGCSAEIDGSQSYSFKSLQPSNSVKVAALIEIVLPDDVLGFSALELPKNLDRVVHHIQGDVEALIDKLDPEAIWRSSSNAAQLKLAIMLRCRQIQRSCGNTSGLPGVPRFHVGEGFFESVQRWQAHGTGKFASVALDKCAHCVLGSPQLEIGEFRVSEKSDAEQRVRSDGAKGFRLHVTKEHEGLRLMFWRKKDSSVELANVGSKSELLLVDGDPEQAE